MPLVSVIIPVYNSEKYLRECLDSVVNQSFKDFEVLLINDGSTDNCGRICDEYAVKDNRFRVFHKENGGVSSARNLGLENAKGEWITFIDSDDYVDENYLRQLILDQKKNKSNLVFQGVRKIENKTEGFLFSFLKDETLYIKHFFECFKVGKYGYPLGKLFNNLIIKQNKIQFDTSLDFGEDFHFILKYLQYVDSIQLSAKHNYVYRLVEGSLSHLIYDYETELNLFKKILKELSNLYDKKIIKKSSQYKESSYYFSRLLRANNNVKGVGNRMENLKFLLKSYPEQFKLMYSSSRLVGKVLIYLAKKDLYFLFDLFYRNREVINGQYFKKIWKKK